MTISRRDGGRHKCADCSVELPDCLTVHCTRSRNPRSATRSAAHYGQRRWTCPRCGSNLGCDECRCRFASEVLCPICRLYMDGKPAVPMTIEERRLLIEMVPHSNPARAILIERLADHLAIDTRELRELIATLRSKGVTILELDGRVYLRSQGLPGERQKFFQVPCYQCRRRQKLEWEYFRWDEGRPLTAL